MRTRKLLGAMTLGAVLAAVVTLLPPPPPSESGITKANFDRIQLGMSLAEVTSILGPPGDHPDEPEESVVMGWQTVGGEDLVDYEWYAGEVGIIVSFDHSDRAVDKNIGSFKRRELDASEKFLRRAKHLWQKCFPE